MRGSILVKRLALGAGGVLIALGLCEASLRVFWPQGLVTDELRYEALEGESGPGYRLEPGQWIPGAHGGAVNTDGLRGAELGSQSERRVLVLGDSFVFGAGVDVAAALPEQLEELAAGGAEFVNAGTPGYGTARELAWLETYGEELQPDELLLCVFMGNDFSDNLSVEPPRVVGGKLFLDQSDADEAGWRLTLRSWRSSLHLWRLLERRSLATEPKAAVSKEAAPDEAKRAAAFGQLLDEFARHEANRLAIYLPDGASETAAARRVGLSYDMTCLALEGVASWCAAREVPLRVVAIPDVLAVDDGLRERAVRLGDFTDLEGADVSALDLERPAKSLAGWCLESGVPFLDLTPAFRERTEAIHATEPLDEGLYLFGDSHWNSAGHTLGAKLIAAWLAALPAKAGE